MLSSKLTHRRFCLLVLSLVGLCLFVGTSPQAKAEISGNDNLSFSSDILPLLRQRCYRCHSKEQRRSGLELQSRAGALEGGLNGPAIVPGQPEQSRLYRRVAGLEEPSMPLDGKLGSAEVEMIRRWIAEGAEWGEESDPASASISDVGPSDLALSDATQEWWAFAKPVRTPVPDSVPDRWRHNPIDAFIMKRLSEQGLEPAPPADRRTLIRRAYLDLWGLLPSPEEVDAFERDESPKAFEAVIDRLLDSPHYGERWGRHWLDVARYADSSGYEFDYDYPYAWRYRDYVIRAFNEDKPYDRFILEQLAGDELDHVTQDSLIATGFHRVMPTVGYREKDYPEYRYNYLNDMIATTSRAFMALSVECARCHDHKFDPISQRDYYRMMAIFFPAVNTLHPLAPAHEVARDQAVRDQISSRIEELQKQLDTLTAPYEKVALEKRREQILAQLPEDVREAVLTAEDQRTPGQKLLADQVIANFPTSVPISGVKVTPEEAREYRRLRGEIRELEAQMPEPLPVAMGICDGDYRFAPDGPGDEPLPGKGNRETYDVEGSYIPVAGRPYVPPPAYFLPSGNYRDKGPEVSPGFPAVITTGEPPVEHPPEDGRPTTGRRRALAEWLVSSDHPLTARVMVNRVWQHHLGRGIVATPSNFGRMGQLPTHPALLDWLATEFVRRGWSVKSLHRLIMSSETYRMASVYESKSNQTVDPENVFLWKFPIHRLEAEAIRDSILSASGKLNEAVGGPPFFPPIPQQVREEFSKRAGKWIMTEEGPAVWRRSVYSYWKRGLRYPFFEVFDQPSPQITCERRSVTTVPTQSLALLNNEFVIQQSRFLAERVMRESGADEESRVRRLYRIVLSRDPTSAELERNMAFLNRQNPAAAAQDSVQEKELEAMTALSHVVFNLNEFVYVN